jgi:formylglycine-generating enzyme required for sulfatase activity
MSEPGAGEKLKVFISYSRRDSTDFADELVAGLAYGGFAPFLDRHDIAAGEAWEARLSGLIEQSDTVVFVVSPESVKSERCTWEVDRTLDLSKRVLPVIYKPVPDAGIPERLRRLQFVRFDTGRGLTRPLAELAEALRLDLDWIREHTRLGELAARWLSRDKPESLLLRGDDLDAAKAWSGKPAAQVLAVTDLQRAFIAASDRADAVRRRSAVRMRVTVGLLLAGVFAGLGYAAWSNEDYLHVRLVLLSDLVSPKTLAPAAERALRPKDSFRECGLCPEMVVIPAGDFMIGSPMHEEGRYDDEGPQRKVTIAKPFAMARFETTFEEWDACHAAGACAYRPGDQGWGRGVQPVINISWNDVQRYVEWLAQRTGKPYRLPSEAEWEYAARAGGDKAYAWGDAPGQNNANCDGCGSRWDNKQAAPVGSFAPNTFGLHDMHGNVWEWVQDCFTSSYDHMSADGAANVRIGDCNRRILRSGSWRFRPGYMRAANRGRDTADQRVNNYGFRVVRTLPEAGP